MSKIQAVIAHPIAAQLRRKHHTAQEAREDVTLILVEVRSDDGLVGYGQISSTPMKDIVNWVKQNSFDGFSPGKDPAIRYKIAELWVTWDNVTVLGQLGVMPAPAGT